MTKEEKELTITYLTKMQEEYIESEGYERHPLPEYFALDLAIKALEQQPSEDCVSRQAVLEMIEQIQDAGGFIGYNTYSKAFDVVDNMSPVTPTFPKGATNYDILKAVFGNISAFRIKDTMEFEKGFELWFSKPYERGNENADTI